MSVDQRGFIARVYKDDRGPGSKYTVFAPHAYRENSYEWPLILFLHGAGQTGNDGVLPVSVGIGRAIARCEPTFPFITVFPQSERGNWRAGSPDGERALYILDQVQREFRVDPDRIHLTGVSMGGFGTWSLAAAYPDRWASIVPVCGGGNPRQAERIRNIPCWAFHGEADEIIPASASRDMVQALRAAGGAPRYTEYPGVGHNSWDPAYATSELYDWLAETRRILPRMATR